jgi:lipoprotein-anchoring transpeptidase ErfK/SrfK
MRAIRALFATLTLTAALAPTFAQEAPPTLTAEAINAASLDSIPLDYTSNRGYFGIEWATPAAARLPDPAVVRLQVLLDRAGASPGVIDGFDGNNVRKAILAFELMLGLKPDGILDPEILAALETGEGIVGTYTITEEDASDIGAPVPEDYAEKAQLSHLGYSSVVEKLAERFHMDESFLVALNPGAQFVPGETIYGVVTGADRTGAVARIEADKQLKQVRAYDADGTLIAAYPATIGSEDNPSPSGTYTVEAATPMPTYTYNPAINFQQGDNTEVLTIPPGPNGPVGSMWIALSKPTFGIHGTPEPSLIDKTGSHGCIRLTNWDAAELAAMVAPGTVVEFLG